MSTLKSLKFLVAAINFVHILYANEPIEIFRDYQNRSIELQQILDEHIFETAAPIFAAAFLKAYEHISDEDLKIVPPSTRQERLNAYFRMEELLPFCEKKFFVVGAFFENHLIGYVSFDEPTESGEVYIRHLVVNTDYWQSGIGKKLIFSPLNLFPDTTCLALVMRRENDTARVFYNRLGFEECEEYLPSPWNPKYFIGYKKMIKTNNC